MTHITQDMALQVLHILRESATTCIDHITIGADTIYATEVLYNAYMNGGEWEFYPSSDTTQYVGITDIYKASQYILGIDAQLPH